MGETRVKITLVRSPIGYQKDQRVTARLLGLRRMNSSCVRPKTPVLMGMINKISHLVTVEELD